jgi:hypothetical protein
VINSIDGIKKAKSPKANKGGRIINKTQNKLIRKSGKAKVSSYGNETCFSKKEGRDVKDVRE